MPLTRRQEIAELLRHGALTAPEIARRIGVSVKSVIADLEHVRRSLKGGGKDAGKWEARDAECLDCGFVFEGRERLDVPSRCPECKSEAIREAAFEIRSGE
jgi:predicted Zn-ribbon and HTH transcriptional regulator